MFPGRIGRLHRLWKRLRLDAAMTPPYSAEVEQAMRDLFDEPARTSDELRPAREPIEGPRGEQNERTEGAGEEDPEACFRPAVVPARRDDRETEQGQPHERLRVERNRDRPAESPPRDEAHTILRCCRPTGLRAVRRCR